MSRVDKQGAKDLMEVFGCITDPIIVYESPWKDSLPEWLPKRIRMDRMVALMVHNTTSEPLTATDSEALAFIYPRTMDAPMQHEWFNIYLHLFNQVMTGEGKTVPDELKPDHELSQYELQLLNHLKRHIYEKRLQHRKVLARQVREGEVEQAKEQQLRVQPHLFDFDMTDKLAGVS